MITIFKNLIKFFLELRKLFCFNFLLFISYLCFINYKLDIRHYAGNELEGFTFAIWTVFNCVVIFIATVICIPLGVLEKKKFKIPDFYFFKNKTLNKIIDITLLIIQIIGTSIYLYYLYLIGLFIFFGIPLMFIYNYNPIWSYFVLSLLIIGIYYYLRKKNKS